MCVGGISTWWSTHRAAREESGLDSVHQLDAVRVLLFSFFFFKTMGWRKELKSHILCHHIDNII